MNSTPNPDRPRSAPAPSAASQPIPGAASGQTSPTAGRRRKHIGVLVIHGMGEANPYDTLDAFARGLYTHFGGPDNPRYTMQTEWKERGSDPAHNQKSWTQAQIRFEPTAAADPAAPRLTVAEYYWSPASKGKVKDLAVLTWLVRTALEPFRYLSENLQVMEAAGEDGTPGKKTRQGLFILWREFFRLACVYPLLLISFIAVAAFLSQVKDLVTTLATLQGHYEVMLVGLLVAARLLILGSLADYFWNFGKWLKFRVPHTGSQRRYSWYALIGAAVIAAAAFALPAWWVHGFFQTASRQVCGAGPVIAEHHGRWETTAAWISQLLLVTTPFTCLFVPVLELAIAAVIRNFLIDFLGDVAIYTNLNQRAGNFAFRAQILEECGHALTTLYTDLREQAIDALAPGGSSATPEDRRQAARQLTGDDFQVVIAAHSLGTVIAYDTINDLFNRARIGAKTAGALEPPGQPADPLAMNVCRHMRGLLTFGSPLNKTYYFFRDESGAEQLIRAQLIDQLHSFRLLAPAGTLDRVEVVPVQSCEELRRLTRDFCWLNVWAEMDIFSGKLFFYELPERCQLRRNYKIPVLAHLSYWTDEKMYQFFAENLLS